MLEGAKTKGRLLLPELILGRRACRTLGEGSSAKNMEAVLGRALHSLTDISPCGRSSSTSTDWDGRKTSSSQQLAILLIRATKWWEALEVDLLRTRINVLADNGYILPTVDIASPADEFAQLIWPGDFELSTPSLAAKPLFTLCDHRQVTLATEVLQ